MASQTKENSDMSDSLPYLVSPGSIKNALEKIRQAATPERVTGDFVSTKLAIKGGTGAALIPFLKKIGLVNSDGTPTDLYKNYRNPATGGAAIASAIKIGYKKLGQVNEYFYDLKDDELKALIVQVSGMEQDSQVVKLTFSTLKTLKAFAKFDELIEDTQTPETSSGADKKSDASRRNRQNIGGINLSYTINLNLPATSEQAVFNAIFRSLKEHILSHADE
jgi:Family of unknown function (DUF5343)